MTDKKIRGQNFNNLYLEERENTIDFTFDISAPPSKLVKIFQDAVWTLLERYSEYLVGTIKVTIEFHPEDEVEDE